VATAKEDLRELGRLRSILGRTRLRGVAALDEEELHDLPRLYRFASSLHARLESQGTEPGTLETTRGLIRRAHSLLYRGIDPAHRPSAPQTLWSRVWSLYWIESPRALRAEWRLLLLVLGFFYGLAIAAYAAVSQNLELAFSLLDPGMVAAQIEQLQATAEGEAFQGNFTFGLGESPQVAGWILAHNMGVSVIFFASGLVPPLFLYLLATNALMVGTYTAVAAHWGQGASISSILWCHGALELQAIVLAGMAGLVLIRAWVAPGPWSRTHAMTLEMRRALLVLAPVFPMLFLAGLIEGFISPHAPTPVRLTVAITTGAAFLAWLLLAGRGGADVDSTER
jgi:uncharacterized membrane protein SpoIIM required for sporulation